MEGTYSDYLFDLLAIKSPLKPSKSMIVHSCFNISAPLTCLWLSEKKRSLLQLCCKQVDSSLPVGSRKHATLRHSNE